MENKKTVIIIKVAYATPVQDSSIAVFKDIFMIGISFNPIVVSPNLKDGIKMTNRLRILPLQAYRSRTAVFLI